MTVVLHIWIITYDCKNVFHHSDLLHIIKGTPHPPTDLGVLAVTSQTIHLKWTSAYNGGFKQNFTLALKQYGSYEVYRDNIQDTNDDGSDRHIEQTIRDLDVEQTYTFGVRAKNHPDHMSVKYSPWVTTHVSTTSK